MTQVVRGGMFHVEHKKRKSENEKHKAEKEKKKKRNLEVLQSEI